MLSAVAALRANALRGVVRAGAASAVRRSAASTAMVCRQCEQTEDNVACTTQGICGKTAEVANEQDELIHRLFDVAAHAHKARALAGLSDTQLDQFVPEMLFSTLTNVNFDAKRFDAFLAEASTMTQRARSLHQKAASIAGKPFVDVSHASEPAGILERGSVFGTAPAQLSELCLYGLKGLCAYAHHAQRLGKESADVWGFVHEAMSAVAAPKSTEQMLGLALRVGEVNLQVMGLLEAGHVDLFGAPTPTQVSVRPTPGKAILISGHDLKDLYDLLEQTEGTGIKVYTHGEMLPAHGYPGLRKFKHLAGNYGSAWQNQKFEFTDFPGPIVMTTNCLIQPLSYKSRLFTRGVVGWSGVKHLATPDYTDVIRAAKEADGFTEDDCTEKPKSVLVGFGKDTLLGAAPAIVEAVQKGHLRHLFFIGGCDGSEGERNYFRKLAQNVPQDCMILTAGCGKYRFNQLDFGGLANTPLPRLVDAGQCNDSYAVLQAAVGLAKAVGANSVNDLPLSLAVSWFEQKAVAVFLTLLHLGVKNIYLGPRLPAFLSADTLALLSNAYGVRKTGDADSDLKRMLGATA